MLIPVNFLITLVLSIILFGIIGYLIFLLIKALRKYINSAEVRNEKTKIKQSLGDVLKAQRIQCNMTQEFVAEAIGVSRQAVSKWESGASEPSTSNLLAIAKLFDIPADELLKNVKQ